MKKLFTLAFVVASFAAVAQEKTSPRSEFAVELSTPTLEIKPGETKDVTVTLLRSKSFSKSNAKLSLSSGLPQGVTITFEPAEGLIESSVAKVAVDKTAQPGTYTLILNGVIQQKSKGKMLKLVVNQGQELSLNK